MRPEMRTFVLADWTTLRVQSASPGNQVTQDETMWLDLEQYSDVVIYLDVREFATGGGGNVVTFFFETAPSKDDPRDILTGAPTFFQPLASQPLTSGSSIATTFVLRALMLTASTPLARYLRWRVLGPSSVTWDTTFRAIVAANAPGL